MHVRWLIAREMGSQEMESQQMNPEFGEVRGWTFLNDLTFNLL